MAAVIEVAQVRLDNALLLFDEFVRAAAARPDPATLRGLERRFAERLQIQPSYWSQIKGRSRQIGERLARQFEQLCKKPPGWMDQPHGPTESLLPGAALAAPAVPTDSPAHLAQDDDERFIVGLVLSYYRRHPQRARQRLLDLLGEVLTPPAARKSAPTQNAKAPPPAAQDDRRLWTLSQAGVAPLKPKR